MDKKSLEAPVFFPSASRVKIPFVGDDTRHIKPAVLNLNPVKNPLARHQKSVGNAILQQACQCLNFDLAVIKDRSAHMLPYDEVEVFKAYDYSDVIEISPRPTDSGGRFNTRGFGQKVPGQFKIMSTPNAALIKTKVKTVTQRHGDKPPVETDQGKVSRGSTSLASAQSHTSEKTSKPVTPVVHYTPRSSRPAKSRKITIQWDECMLDKLSKDTARWIVTENVEVSPQKERLGAFLKGKFGTLVSNTTLIQETEKEIDYEKLERQKIENMKKKIAAKKREEKQAAIDKVQNDPILCQTFAQYYKLPRYLKQKRRLEPKPTNVVNQTAHNLKVKHLEPLPPTKMEDFLNPAAGNFVYATDNAFEQQLYTNQAKPVYQTNGNKNRIIMNDLSEYQCNLQSRYPPSHNDWAKEQRKTGSTSVKLTRPVRGMQRWKELPDPADFASELGLNLPQNEFEEETTFIHNQNSQRLGNVPMVNIIEDWRSKWKLAGSWQEVTLADVMLDMDSLHTQVRLGAVAACAVAALHKIPVEEVTVLAVLPKIDASLLSNREEVGHLFKGLIEKVRERLDDSHKRVQLAAAMCLYTLNECTEKVMNILQYHLEHAIPTDRIACAQCLALKGSTDAKVVHLIIQMLLETDQQDQATALLIHLSHNTRLAHSLLAEQLNSCCWKDKVIACNVLSELSGNINRDLVHKLSNLMWEDWSSEVRIAASRALGRTGHGRAVHFELREKLIRGNERVRVDVLQKIAHIGIMTASLLPEFLKCFSAEYVSVRLEAVRAAMKLKIRDEKIVSELIRLTEFDPAWKIKAYAIKALGEIEIVSEKIRRVLVWALRFENEPGVRLEACVALKKLRINEAEVLKVLQDRVLVEPDPIVKQEVQDTLDAFNMSGPEDNMEMIRQIKKEVRKLSKKSVVAAKVILYEQELDKFERKAQYIGDISDDVSPESESDDDVDLEITHALMRPKSTGRRSGSILRTPSDVVTPQITISPGTPRPDRPFTSEEASRTPVIFEEPETTPSAGGAKQTLLPDASCT